MSPTVLKGRYYYQPQFTDEETGTERHSGPGIGMGIEAGEEQVDLRVTGGQSGTGLGALC